MGPLSKCRQAPDQRIVILDDVVNDQALLAGADYERLAACSMWWDCRVAQTPSEKLVQAILGKCRSELPKILGVEYWLNVFDAGNDYWKEPMHDDKDEFLLKTCGLICRPIMSLVFFPKKLDIDGGELVFASREVVPLFNRAVLFDGSVQHGPRKTLRGTRYSLAINLWNVPNYAMFRSLLGQAEANRMDSVYFRPIGLTDRSLI